MSKLPTNRSLLSPPKPVFRQTRIASGVQQRHSTGEILSNSPLRIGDRVVINEKSGTVAFIGSTQFADGEWIGIVLDEAQGKNDGSLYGVRYFNANHNHGIFCRPDKVQRLPMNSVSRRISLYNPSRLPIIDDNNNTSGNITTDMLNPSSIKDFEIGDRVVIRGTKYGTLKYIGKIHVDEGIWCGIKLDGPLGKHNGKVAGVRYFRCPHRFGIFAPLRHVEKVAFDLTDSQTHKRQSIISASSHNQFHDSTSQDSNLSEFSISSNSASPLRSRSPNKIHQSNLSTDITNRKRSSTPQISNLIETIKEKDSLIEKLQQTHEKDHFKYSHAVEKFNDIETHVKTLKKQYEIKENENKNLIREHFELIQRVKDLQCQLEENESPDLNENHLIIPHDHRLLSPNEITIYEQTKQKFIELESLNQNLIHEKQICQEQLKRQNDLKEKEAQTNKFIDELKLQIQLLTLQITDLHSQEESKTLQLAEKETFYKDQVKEYQSKIDQITKEEQNVRLRLITLEHEKQTNEKQINDLNNELNRYKENIIPDLEQQCEMLKSELQTKDNKALNEREMYYEQQIKEYQTNINQAIRETEQIRGELKQIAEENNLKEKTTNTLINELKQNYEKVQTELTEINHREKQTNMILNQRESYYEELIKEYETNINRATLENQNIQAEFARLEEEKVSHDQQLNNTINTLKQNYEIQIKEYQIKIDEHVREIEDLQNKLTKLQEEKITNEQQLNTTINKLKQDFEKLYDREHHVNTTLNQTESQYQQQIKEYETNLAHVNEELQNIQMELTKLQTEKVTNEQQLNKTISQLKQDIEKLQNEFNDREHHVNTTLNQTESQYQQQIKEYETNLAHANEELQNIQMELTKLQTEKVTNEQQLNKTISQLKQDIEKLQNEFNDRENNANITFKQTKSKYKQQIKEHETNLAHVNKELETIQIELRNLQTEKTANENELNKLKQDYEKLQNEFNDREYNANINLNQNESQYQQQIKEYENNLAHANEELQNIQTELIKLQIEKTTNEKEINQLKHDYETLQNELQNRDDTQKLALNEYEVHYQSQIKEYQTKQDQSLLDIQNLQSELTKLQEIKTTIENQLNETIIKLKQDYERQYKELQNEIDELNEREHQAHKALHQRESQFEHEIREYEDKLEQSARQIQHIQTELTKLHEEKTTIENELNKTINKLKRDIKKLQNEGEPKGKLTSDEYEQQIDEYQKNLELAVQKIQDVQSELANLLEEKETNEKVLNDIINSSKLDFEKQIQTFKIQNIELQKNYDIKTKELIEKDEQIKEYQLKFNQLNEEINELNEQDGAKLTQLNQFVYLLEQKEQTNKQINDTKQRYKQTQNELLQRIETLTTTNETLEKQLEDLKTENEQLKKIDNNASAETSVDNDQVTQQLHDLQQVHINLLEKQANMEQKYVEEKQAQEKILQEKIGQYEMKIALMKSEYMVEMENQRLDHDQEILRLKTQLQQTTPAKGKK